MIPLELKTRNSPDFQKIVGSIFRKSLRLSGRARNEHSIGQITTMISSDATHLDLFTGFAHQSVPFFGV